MRPKFFVARAGVLQVRREQAEAAFEDVRRTGDAGLGEQRRGDAALRRRTRSAGTSVCVPSTQHSSRPAAKLPHVPAAQASRCASSPSSLPAPNAMPNGANSPVG